jgi:hypothetical protein
VNGSRTKIRKRIFFHIGLPKTGSSALQALLSINAQALHRIGISYPNPENAQITACSGQGNRVWVRLVALRLQIIEAR